MKTLAALLLAALPAAALQVEVASFGFDGFERRGRPAPVAVRVTADRAFRGDFALTAGPVTRVFLLDIPANGSELVRATFVFVEAPAVTWSAAGEGGALAIEAKEPLPGEALVAVEKAAAGRRADRFKMDPAFPPASRFFFAEFPRDATPDLLAAVDAVILKDGTELQGSAGFLARGGAILTVAEGGNRWQGIVDPRDDISWGEDAYAVLERPAWAAGPRPYLGRLFGFALAPILLAALAGALVPGSSKLRGGVAAAVLAAGAALAPLAAPKTLASRESYAIEVLHGGEADRLEVAAVTLPARPGAAFALAAGPVPEPVFFSRHDALERHITIRHEKDAFLVSQSGAEAGTTLALLRRSTRAVPGSLRVEGARATNQLTRDLHDAFIVSAGRASWIGDIPAGESREATEELKISEVRSRLGATPSQRLFVFWWRRADHAQRWLVGFAPGETPTEGDAAARRGLGTLVVLPLPK